ncbi:MAG: peptidoglycan editing factor PgeF [Xanthomonadales bacterium]|nr:peptidoglycan editing factor PgeF [Xanthomonadales bacterium]
MGERSVASSSLLWADWDVAGVCALTTLRGPAGVSVPPYERFNLGLRSGDRTDHVLANREALIELAGLPGTPRWLHQVHGTRVLQAEAASCEGDEPAADAAISVTPGTVLAILTADCLPVVFAAEDGSEVAVAHAGWRGMAAGVLQATLAAMRTSPSRLLAWLGPAAGPDAYEVGEEVRASLLDQAADDRPAFHATRPGHWHCDLYTLARRRLRDAGVDRIHGGRHCTISDAKRFYSYRRDGAASGRMATLVWMR